MNVLQIINEKNLDFFHGNAMVVKTRGRPRWSADDS